MAEHSARRPLIGVTAGTTRLMSGAWEGHEAVVLTEHYVAALRAAGARPVILAPQDPWTDEEIAELDGLVLTGGTDLDPALYGASALPSDFAPDRDRDAFEVAAYHAARRAGIPVLGICRGLQLIAVAEGGTLHQHLAEDLPRHPASAARVTEVEVAIDAASDVALAVGTVATVPAYHHQGVADCGEGLRVVARHASGLALALEARDGSPVVAVQWHPELTAAEAAGEGIVSAFVATAARAPRVPGPRPLV
ncbi:gamma-glutamyl-gamma-aminobutyrate hydrolase family protein [Brachybacterium huguangmaarense]|uniref:Gamma-glutamyl-gamma-aminobutyrate hydrolase family protein n=1 Tax=Brachybacterium huguangmaarense TaxID=1652028 RepID=A0ABY6G0Q0_9MICO|nr:gamma-glutamyl-gamma-aminobutyrate hydrolase family protein [Brachybacterium huguangmaarense]UYG16707.1 gamma-glutamyl-gamma-aminobutyrate hydrolase family protein [Brachybacterium huguangmaarense]